METNGEKLPTIQLMWDADAQQVGIQFKPTDFKTWDFVLAVLDMARQKAEEAKKMAQLGAMQKQMTDQAQAEAIRRSLSR